MFCVLFVMFVQRHSCWFQEASVLFDFLIISQFLGDLVSSISVKRCFLHRQVHKQAFQCSCFSKLTAMSDIIRDQDLKFDQYHF